MRVFRFGGTGRGGQPDADGREQNDDRDMDIDCRAVSAAANARHKHFWISAGVRRKAVNGQKDLWQPALPPS